MERIHLIFINLLQLSVAINASLSDFYLSENIPLDYAKYEKAMDQFSEKMKDFNGFSYSQMDDFEIKSTADSHCKWITKVEKPYSITNRKIEYPVVQTEKFQQKIQTTRCLEIDTQRCGRGIGLEQFNITMACHEKYENTLIYIYDTKTKKILSRYVDVPVCCLCGVNDI